MSLLDRLTERRAVLAEQAERLRKELAEVEYELGRVTVAEQVVAQLLTEEHSAGEHVGASAEPCQQGTADPSAGSALLVPHRRQVGDEAADGSVLPDDYRRIWWVVVQAGEPVRCKAVCQAVGAGTEPKHVETMRAKLKRLEDRGWLRRNGAGAFLPLP